MPKRKKTKKWIQAAHMKKGALHRQLGISVGEAIPLNVLKEHEHDEGKLGRRVRMALNLRKLRKK